MDEFAIVTVHQTSIYTYSEVRYCPIPKTQQSFNSQIFFSNERVLLYNYEYE